MLSSTFSFLLVISKCLAYSNQWVPNFYLSTYPEKYQTLRMNRGACIVSLTTIKNNHFNVEIPLINGSTPAGFCAILLNSAENLSLAIALEQELNDVNNNLINQNIKLFEVKNTNVKRHDVFGLSDVPGITLVKSNTAILLIKADQSLKFSLSVYTYESLNNKS